MVAKTYDEKRNFDLVERYEALRDGEEGAPCLRGAKFDTIPEVVVMQCVAACTIRGVRSRDILKIKREIFIDNWTGACSSLLHAVDFVRSQLRVPVSQMLPYPSMLVPLTYWFNRNANKKPTIQQRAQLEQWFYWVGLNSRYSSASEAKIVEDFERMDAILKGQSPQYPPAELTVSPEEMIAGGFSAGDSWCKTILCLLAFQQPKSFDTNGLVILDNSNLRIATSRNYHHFFPKAYLASKRPQAEPNLMMNITLIDGYSNQHLIGRKAPATYIREFKKTNTHLDDTLKSHCIADIERFGIASNDYDTFIRERSKVVARKLNAKLRGSS